MPEKPYQNRLDSIFSQCEAKPSEIELPTLDQPLGWLWQCDENGVVTECSPEIEAALGILPQQILGENIFSFRLSPVSIEELAQAMETHQFPKEYIVAYQGSPGEYLPVKLGILAKRQQAEKTLLQGYCLLMGEVVGGSPVVEGKSTAGMIFKTINSTAPIIKSLLLHLSKTTPAIQKAGKSHVISHTSQKFEDDPANTNKKIEVLFGKRVATTPQIEILIFEQRLEWGEKMDFTPEEQAFVREHKFAPVNPMDKLRARFLPSTLQRSQKNWIGVTVSARGEQPAQIAISCAAEEISAKSYSLPELIEEPTILIPDLLKAIEHPIREDEVWRKGVDYLIPG